MSILENRIPPPVVMLITLIAMWLIASADSVRLLKFNYSGFVAVFFVVLGFSCAIKGVLHFKEAKTTVNPLAPETASSLVTNGIYQFTRNPMYLGMALLICGAAIHLSSLTAWLGLVFFLFFITRFQILPEERAMALLFENQFTTYCTNVRRWL